MEPEGSLPHLQVPATSLYPQPDQSSPCPSQPTSWRSILILYSHLRLGLPSGLFPSGFPTKTLYTPFLFHTCYMPRPSHSRFYHPNRNLCFRVPDSGEAIRLRQNRTKEHSHYEALSVGAPRLDWYNFQYTPGVNSMRPLVWGRYKILHYFISMCCILLSGLQVWLKEFPVNRYKVPVYRLTCWRGLLPL